MRVLIFSFVLSSCYCLLGFPRWQTVGAMGLLLCNGEPAAGVFMVLYDKGYFHKTKLAYVATDKNGFFKFSGTAKEIFQISPKLLIYTWCNRKRDGFNSKMKEVCIDIPPKYISRGKKVKQYWDVDIELGTEANLCSISAAQ
ncbi:unnamed protein product [Cylicocyclus nassatus]|uniref:Transthyretin-like family protein n=1 Tax=Cylicocyclus nassatus TaxID=53992 RepID=A0AA36HAX8_CYLNA|nr:unnamed protein product [Cylicocyclus nassatus]